MQFKMHLAAFIMLMYVTFVSFPILYENIQP